MPAEFPSGIGGATAPIEKWVAVDISSTDFTPATPSRAMLLDAAAVAAVKYDTPDSTANVHNNLACGVIHPIRVSKVYKTGTNQTGIYLGY